MSEIRENLNKVQETIEASCRKAGRDPKEVTLIAVSKTKPVSSIQEAYDAGVRDFGENRVQELMEKMDLLPGDIRWHLIGHLQKNKVKYIVGKTALIHSVDSLELAKEIDRQAEKKGVDRVDILIEVNIGNEESKFGVKPEDAPGLVDRILSETSRIGLHGIMCVAPYVVNPEENRQYFVKMRKIIVDIMNEVGHNVHVDVMSMGMTGDYPVAIEEGATMIRVGTGIFGERDYPV